MLRTLRIPLELTPSSTPVSDGELEETPRQCVPMTGSRSPNPLPRVLQHLLIRLLAIVALSSLPIQCPLQWHPRRDPSQLLNLVAILPLPPESRLLVTPRKSRLTV